MTVAPSAPRSRHRPPGPRQRFPGQFLYELTHNKLAMFESMARLGDVSQIMLGFRQVVLLSHPDDVKRVLVTNQRSFSKGVGTESLKPLVGDGLLTLEGDVHLRQRRLIQPAFHRERITGYAAVMAEHAERAQAGWRDGETRDVHEDMMRLTLGIAGKTLFDADVDTAADVIGEALDLSFRVINYTSTLPFGPLWEHVPLPWIRRMHRARRRMNALITGLIEERRTAGTDRGDLLSMLIAARDTAGDGSGMTDDELRDELVTLILAGHETTAVALTWTWYVLSRSPDIEARLHAELDAVLGGNTPTADDIPRLTYTRMVFNEVMRLYPPVWMMERRVVEDIEIGGFPIKAGAIVLMSPRMIQRDPRWWPEPERFDPERWAPGQGSDRPKFAFFPFGGGTRICVGEQFAWMEGVLILAAMAQRWRMRMEPTHSAEPAALVTFRPKYGMRMRLERRGR